MVELSELKRAQYANFSPIFWRPAAGASKSQRKFFGGLIDDRSWICLVHEAAAGVDGFILARVVSAPPVYDPGGKVCMIDDFMVADALLWPSVGMALHTEAERIAAESGAVASVTVCGQRDVVKGTQLRKIGADVSSEWYVHKIGDQ
jgi:hypothetical protein